jgi:hypothetical protein
MKELKNPEKNSEIAVLIMEAGVGHLGFINTN